MINDYIKLRIVIADDHQVVCEGLRNMLKHSKHLEIVGEASNGQELIKQTRALNPDALLVDVRMPKCDGIEATKIIKKEFPIIGVVALSSFDDEHLVMDMLNAGAKGYLLKNAGIKEITEAVFAAYKDEAYYCQEINYKLAQVVSGGGLFNNDKKETKHFNKNQLFIIVKICEGLSSKQIADLLDLKTRTIERYRDTMMKEMEVRNVAGLVMYAVKHGLYKEE